MSRRRCAEEELLSAFLDGELRPGELEAMADHLDRCGDCRVTFARLKEVRSALRRLPPLLPPPDVIADVTHPGEDLSAFLDGELGPARSGEVVGHLSRCAACRHQLHELDAARSAVRSLPRLELPTPSAAADPWPRRRWRVPVAAALTAVVAAGALVVGLIRDEAATIERDRLAEWHNARMTLGRGASVLPATLPDGGEGR